MLHRLPAFIWITGVHWIWVTTTSNGVCVCALVDMRWSSVYSLYILYHVCINIWYNRIMQQKTHLVTMELDHHPQKGEWPKWRSWGKTNAELEKKRQCRAWERTKRTLWQLARTNHNFYCNQRRLPTKILEWTRKSKGKKKEDEDIDGNEIQPKNTGTKCTCFFLHAYVIFVFGRASAQMPEEKKVAKMRQDFPDIFQNHTKTPSNQSTNKELFPRRHSKARTHQNCISGDTHETENKWAGRILRTASQANNIQRNRFCGEKQSLRKHLVQDTTIKALAMFTWSFVSPVWVGG